MKSLLILNKIKVENANAIAGMVYGFPAVTHFLGYVHALSRKIKTELKEKFNNASSVVELGGCGIVCHSFQIKAHKTTGWGDYVFSLTKNPLDENGRNPSFNEEGKMHMEVTLLIECDFTASDFDFGKENTNEKIQEFQKLIYQLAPCNRLAGGIITALESVDFSHVTEEAFFRKKFCKILPGFVLQDSKKILENHLKENQEISPLDALLDFYLLKSKAIKSKESSDDEIKGKWALSAKPKKGWFVPLQVGYKAISPLYREGEVAAARDQKVPFRFVEPIFGLGEWIGLHRIKDPETIFWRYHQKDDLYLCINKI